MSDIILGEMQLRFADLIWENAPINSGKLAKLGCGIMNTHSKEADGRAEVMAACAIRAGCSAQCANKILESVREFFDYIIIDTAPVGLVADTEEIASLVDASLLVVRHDYTWARDINDVVDLLDRVSGKVIGCVLSDVPTLFASDASRGAYGYGYGYGGSYGKQSKQ